jgi:hypothetical protein
VRGKKWLWHNLRQYPAACLKKLRKMQKLQSGKLQGQNMILRLNEYKVVAKDINVPFVCLNSTY